MSREEHSGAHTCHSGRSGSTTTGTGHAVGSKRDWESDGGKQHSGMSRGKDIRGSWNKRLDGDTEPETALGVITARRETMRHEEKILVIV